MGDYRQELEAKLQAARNRVKQGAQVKHLKAAAPTLFEIIDGEITLEVNKGYGDKPLSYDEYLESHGAVRGIKRIRNLLDSKEAEAQAAQQEVDGITSNIEQLKDDEKKRK